MNKVLIAPAPLAGVDSAYPRSCADAGFELVYPAEQCAVDRGRAADDAHRDPASLAGSEPYTRAVLQAHPQLRVIARAGVGYDAVDVAAATELGVAVTITPGTNQDAVAEHTFALILAIAKGIVPQHRGTCELKWPRRATIPLRGRTLGIAGLGRIGKAVALRGEAFRMRLHRLRTVSRSSILRSPSRRAGAAGSAAGRVGLPDAAHAGAAGIAPSDSTAKRCGTMKPTALHHQHRARHHHQRAGPDRGAASGPSRRGRARRVRGRAAAGQPALAHGQRRRHAARRRRRSAIARRHGAVGRRGDHRAEPRRMARGEDRQSRGS